MNKPFSKTKASPKMLLQHTEDHDRIDVLVQRAFQVTRPLLRLTAKRPAEHVGCCVLLKIAEQRFLLTAEHVLREFAGEPIYIAFHGYPRCQDSCRMAGVIPAI